MKRLVTPGQKHHRYVRPTIQAIPRGCSVRSATGISVPYTSSDRWTNRDKWDHGVDIEEKVDGYKRSCHEGQRDARSPPDMRRQSPGPQEEVEPDKHEIPQ